MHMFELSQYTELDVACLLIFNEYDALLGATGDSSYVPTNQYITATVSSEAAYSGNKSLKLAEWDWDSDEVKVQPCQSACLSWE